jgi:hypothetical protein
MANEKSKTKEPYADLYNIPRATIAEIKDQIKLSYKYQQHRGVFCIVGESGIGKSQFVDQLAQEENARLVDIRTAQWSALSGGVPSVNDAGDGRFKVLVPDYFPKEGERCIMKFDEINQGAPQAIAMFFSLFEDRNSFNYKLPDDTLVVAQMNPDTANYAVTRIENNAALRRRMKVIYAIFSYKGWLTHAQTKNFHMSDTHCSLIPADGAPCHPAILEYFTASPSSVDEAEMRMANKQFTSPAGIQTISMDAYILDAEGKSLVGESAQIRFSSSIGVAATADMIAFLRDSSIIISPMDVITNFKSVAKKVKKLVAEDKNEHLLKNVREVLTILFTKTPDIEVAAANILDYLTLLTNDVALAFLSQMQKYALENNAQQYNTDLSKQFYQYEEWLPLHARLQSADKSVNADLNDDDDDED